MDHILSLIGLARKAGQVEIGEDCVDAAARLKKIRLLFVAGDAAENTVRRAKAFAKEGNCLLSTLPYTKEELGKSLGRGDCAIIGITDIGFASAIAEKLAATDETAYREVSDALKLKLKRAAERKSQQVHRDRNKKRT